MRMEFDNGVLSLQNAEGRAWQLARTEKPNLSFAYDALSVTNGRAVRRVGNSVQPLTKKEIDEVAAFIAGQAPPSPRAQFATDLKTFAYGLINTAVGRLRFGNQLDVQIAARDGSTDLRAGAARQALAYVDSVWNAYHGLVAQIDATPEDELGTFADYANMLPMVAEPDRLNGRQGAAIRANAGATVAGHLNGGTHGEPPHEAEPPGRPVALFAGTPGAADFSAIVDRAFVFDDVFPAAQLQLYEKWALQSPHWMLSNSSHDEHGDAKHRIWGASFIEAWRRKGWVGLPPMLFSMIATMLQKLDLTITDPEYIGLNGQSKDQTASMHTDCAHDSADDLSILFYLGEDTDGDLLLYDKSDTTRVLHRIPYRPNRIVAFDGSIPHQALAPTDDKFRMSLIVRGKYKVGAMDLIGG